MKHIFALGMCALLLTACGRTQTDGTTSETPTTLPVATEATSTLETSILEPETNSPTRTCFTLYAPNESLDGFSETEVEVDELHASNVIQELVDAGVLNEDIIVNEYHLENSNLSIDLNAAFRDQILALGSTGERYLIGSIVNTFLSAYDADTVSITIDGEILESGHVIYDFPLEFIN